MSEDLKENNKWSRNFTLITVAVGILILVTWVLTYIILRDNSDKGSIGDLFGSINALYSGLALAGIILTILLQRKELFYQREELRETRKEFKAQNETLRLQRFENTFFNLLSIHHEIVNSIEYRYYKHKELSGTNYQPLNEPEEKEVVIITGRDVFRHRYNSFYRQATEVKELHKLLILYYEHYLDAQTDFGHYFRTLYRILKFVDQTEFFPIKTTLDLSNNYEIKYHYIAMIRAQISDYELAWIFYNCLSTNGVEKFKPLIEKYTFFKNLPINLLIDQDHKSLYDIKAYSK